VILAGGLLLPLLVLFMRATDYGYVWIAAAVEAALVVLLVYALRNA
jgi:hypothetical protein